MNYDHRKIWRESLNISEDIGYKNFVCSIHFRTSDFIHTSRGIFLHPHAVPFVNNDYFEPINDDTQIEPIEVNDEQLDSFFHDYGQTKAQNEPTTDINVKMTSDQIYREHNYSVYSRTDKRIDTVMEIYEKDLSQLKETEEHLHNFQIIG